MSFRKTLTITCLVAAALFSCSESPTSSNPFDDDASDETQARGSLSGYVNDPYGDVLSGVLVSLVNEELVQGGFTTTTNQQGFFRINDVLAGTYEITFIASATDFSDTSFTISFAIGEQKTLPQAMVMALPVTIILDAQSPFDHPTPDTVSIAFGRDSDSLPVLTREGYSFAGWWTEPWGQGVIISDYSEEAVAEAAGTVYAHKSGILYAHWNSEDGGSWAYNGTTLVDPDGNLYTTVVIGSQRWTVENLRTTKYADGTAIPYLSIPYVYEYTYANDTTTVWGNQSTPAYCLSNETGSESITPNGALYNWWVVDPANAANIAPDGWRVPTDADWDLLQDYLVTNGHTWDGTAPDQTETAVFLDLGELQMELLCLENKIAKALASAGGEWLLSESAGNAGNDQPSNNSTGFSALPGGFRNQRGDFSGLGQYGFWWSATIDGESYASSRLLHYDHAHLIPPTFGKSVGLSVRLVQDVN